MPNLQARCKDCRFDCYLGNIMNQFFKDKIIVGNVERVPELYESVMSRVFKIHVENFIAYASCCFNHGRRKHGTFLQHRLLGWSWCKITHNFNLLFFRLLYMFFSLSHSFQGHYFALRRFLLVRNYAKFFQILRKSYMIKLLNEDINLRP